MNEYFGILVIPSLHDFDAVRIFAKDVDTAKSAYEDYCNKMHGYVWNLYPVHDGNVDKFHDEEFKDVPTIYA